MTNTLIIEKAIEELRTRTFGFTEQFLEIHTIAYTDNKPLIARVNRDKEDEAIVYFSISDQKFFLAIGVGIAPGASVLWVNTEPFHSVYFRAASNNLSLAELSQLTKLKPTGSKNKGDKKRPGTGIDTVWEQSIIDFEPNPEADDFEDKLTKLLNYLEQDKEGVEKLVNNAGGYIQVYTSFHNGNSMLGGHYITKDQIKRMSKLNLEIDFDISAEGNLFT